MKCGCDDDDDDADGGDDADEELRNGLEMVILIEVTLVGVCGGWHGWWHVECLSDGGAEKLVSCNCGDANLI